MFKDIDIFVAAAQAIWLGQDPYTLPGVEAFYPLPFYLLFLPFAWLPLPVVHVIWTALSALVFVAILKKRSLFVIWSSQALLTFLLGQVDIVFMGLYALIRSGAGFGGIALGFMVFKPQLVLLLAPFLLWQWLRTDRRQLLWFFGIVGALLAASFIAQPGWVFSLLARSGERMRAGISSSLWGMLSFLPAPLWLAAAALIATVLIIWAWRARSIDLIETVGLFISPFVFAYNLMPIYVMFRERRVLLGLALLSWLAFALAAFTNSDAASALVTIAALVMLYQSSARPQWIGSMKQLRGHQP